MKKNQKTTKPSSSVMRDLADIKKLIPDYQVHRVKDVTEFFNLVPAADELIIQTGAVTVCKADKKGFLVLPTLLSFNRTSRLIILPHVYSLPSALTILTKEDLLDSNSYDSDIKKLGRNQSFEEYAKTSSSSAIVKKIFMLIYPLKGCYLSSWKTSMWTDADCKYFLSDKGFIHMRRFIIKEQPKKQTQVHDHSNIVTAPVIMPQAIVNVTQLTTSN